MKRMTFSLLTVCVASFLFLTSSCNSSTTTTAETPDMGKVKKDIQDLSNKWAAAENARDAKTVSEFYAGDAVRLANNRPVISGKANILKYLEEDLANTPKGVTIAFETLEVLGTEKDVLEVGTAIQKDSTGNIVYKGKYMTYWQNRNGKYLAVRDMSNDDAKSN